jgi:signal transduction histidine kinase
MEGVDLTVVARDAAELYEPVAEAKSISLSVLTEPGSLVRGNKSLIAQALANLIDNAIKYSPEGGAVKVRVRPSPLGPELSVADTGEGIPEEDRERVLQRFVRLEVSRNAPGSGLGLSLVAAVARMHNATLELGDNKPGLRVTLRFPFMALPAPAPVPEKPQPVAALPLARRAAL